MRAWSAPEVPSLPVVGPPVAVHDTATDALVTPEPDGAGAALRLRHHALRRHPPRPRRDVHRLRPAQPGLADRRARRDLRPERHRRRRPAPRARRQGARGLGRARGARDRAVPHRHAGAAGAAAGPLRRRGGVDPARDRDDRAAADRPVRRTPSTATSTTPPPPIPRSGRESGYDRATMLQLSAERGGDPEREGKKDPLDVVVWRGPRDDEPVLGQPVRTGSARLAHRVRRRSPVSTSARPSTCRAAAATSSSRTTR